MKRLGVFGTSGFAREVADIAIEVGYSPVYVARDENEAPPNLGDIVLERDVEKQAGDMVFAIGIGDNTVRARIAERFAGKLRFANLVHPSATFGHRQRAAIDAQRGTVVCAGVRFTNSISIGDFTIFNLNATIGHDCIIGDFVNVAPLAAISGYVQLDRGCWIGTGAAVNQGMPDRRLTVGANSVVGSGSVVVRDCEPDGVYVGVPAKRIK